MLHCTHGVATALPTLLARPSDLLGADGMVLLLGALGLGAGVWAVGDVLGERRARLRAPAALPGAQPATGSDA